MKLLPPTDRPLRIAMTSYYMPSASKIGVGYQVHALANAMVDRVMTSLCSRYALLRTEAATGQSLCRHPGR